MRTIGMDIHRSFAQVAILEDGAITRQLRVELVHEPLVALAKTLIPILIDQDPWAHARHPMDMMRQGRSMRQFQAWQQ